MNTPIQREKYLKPTDQFENNLEVTNQVKILFFSPDPKNAPRLRLGNELQMIRDRIDRSFFSIEDRQAVKPNDVIQSIIEFEPNIVHFSGHGLQTGELCFEDEQGNAAPVPPEALSLLFKIVKDFVKCVIVNTCYSEEQAKAIAEYIPVVIGTKKQIGDKAAISFSTGFYTALKPDLSRNTIQRAFEMGKVAIQLSGSLDEHITPVLIFGEPSLRFSSEIENAVLRLSSVNAPEVYILKKTFEIKGKKMGLDALTISNIIEEKFRRITHYKNKIAEYEDTLSKILDEEFPLSESTQQALDNYTEELDLNALDVNLIKEKLLNDSILDSPEAWYDRGILQSRQQNDHQAIKYFKTALEKNPDYSAAYYYCGNTYNTLGLTKEAVAYCTKAIEVNKNWENLGLYAAYFDRGYAYFNFKYSNVEERKIYLDKAFEDWSETIKLSPKDSLAYYNRALIHDFFSRYLEAAKDYKLSLLYEPKTEKKLNTLKKIIKNYTILGDKNKVEEYSKYLENLNNDIDIPLNSDQIENGGNASENKELKKENSILNEKFTEKFTEKNFDDNKLQVSKAKQKRNVISNQKNI